MTAKPRRGRPPGPSGARLRVLTIKVSPAEVAAFERAAGTLPLSAWIREVARLAAGLDEGHAQKIAR